MDFHCGKFGDCSYLRRLVGRRGYRIFELVCLSVCPQHNSKKNDPKVFKLGVGNDLGYATSVTVLGFKGQGHQAD